jgi:saccharopine dehydrogenase-like NADP-dependent oxidoreductase
VPVTFQDVVVIFCTVSGWKGDLLVQVSDARKVFNASVEGQNWSAIQLTTAAGVCVMVDLLRQGTLGSGGFVRQESVSLDAFLKNRFGVYYRGFAANTFSLAAANFEGELT